MARRRRRSSRRDDMPSARSVRMAMVSAIIVAAGLFYLMVGMALLLQPEWFFENLGAFPPYNRLVLGQLGSLMLPLGVVLIIASQGPARSRMIVGAAAAAAVLLALNQWYAASIEEIPVSAWLNSILPLMVLAFLLCWAFWQVRPRLRRR